MVVSIGGDRMVSKRSFSGAKWSNRRRVIWSFSLYPVICIVVTLVQSTCLTQQTSADFIHDGSPEPGKILEIEAAIAHRLAM